MMLNLNYVDYAILFILLLSIFAGLIRGFVKEVIALLTWVAAFILASLYSTPLAAAFTHVPVDSSSLSLLSVAISFVCIFVLVLLVGMLISYIISSMVELGGISFFNRLLGAVFGFARGFLVVLLLIFLVQLTAYAKEDLWVHSRLVNAFQPAVKWIEINVSPNFDTIKASGIEMMEKPKTTEKKTTKTKTKAVKEKINVE